MIALFDIDKTLTSKIQKKIENESVYEVKSITELTSLLETKIDLYSKVLINTNSISENELKNKILPLIDSSRKKTKVVFYEVNSSIATIINHRVFENTTKNDSKKDSLEDVFSKIKAITSNKTKSKYKHVVVGVSTGGPVTLETFLPLFPPDIDVSIVVIQHILQGNYLYNICDRLNEISQLEVKVAEQGEILKKGVVYFAPPKLHLSYKQHSNGDVSLNLTPEYLKRRESTLFNERSKFVHIPSVDIGIESASDIYKDGLIAVILTGMGSDGAIALKYARDNGAYTLSEAESTAIIYGMPRVAFEKGGSMEVLKHYLIPNRILELINYKKYK